MRCPSGVGHRLLPLAVIAATFSTVGATEARASAPSPLLGHPVEYVVVTNAALAPAFAPLVDWKIRTGVPAAVKTMGSIVAEYPVAADDAERVRLFLKDARAAGVKWVLIGGGPDIVPIRYARTLFYGGQMLPTDLYYAALDGNWNADGDAFYGEGYQSSLDPGDDADLVADVWVGRAPVHDPAQAARFVARTLKYERTPEGLYEDSRLMAAQVLFPYPWHPGDFVSFDGAEIAEGLLPVFTGHGLPVTRLYQNETNPAWVPGAIHETRADVLAALDAGTGFATLIGRGSATNFDTGDGLITNADALALTNATRPFPAWIFSGQQCEPDSESLGEMLLRAPGGGAVACVGTSFYGFPTAERNYLDAFTRAVHDTGVVRIGQALARAREPFVPYSIFDSVNRWLQMTLELYGDPELSIWTARPRALTVSHPPSVSPGQSVPITVAFDGAPVAGAKVTLYQPGNVLLVLVTDANGQAGGVPAGAVDGELFLTVTARDFHPYEDTMLFGTIVATTASLWRSVVTPARVELTWDTPAWAPGEARLERRTADSAWRTAGRIESEVAGLVVSADESVAPGTRYDYRLARGEGASAEYSVAATVDVPRFALVLDPPMPNPVEGAPWIHFSLAGAGQATLSVYDLAGRRHVSRGVFVTAPGPHTIRLDEAAALAPGLYVMQLREGGRSVARRFVVR